MEPVRIVVGCVNPLVQRGLCSIMADAADIAVIGLVDAQSDLYRLAKDLAPDLLVLDVEMLGCEWTPGAGLGERIWFSRQVIAMLADQVHRKTAGGGENVLLTEREVDVLQALAGGRRNVDIAEELGISMNTVQFHLKNIYSKLNVSNRSEAILWAVHNGFA